MWTFLRVPMCGFCLQAACICASIPRPMNVWAYGQYSASDRRLGSQCLFFPNRHPIRSRHVLLERKPQRFVSAPSNACAIPILLCTKLVFGKRTETSGSGASASIGPSGTGTAPSSTSSVAGSATPSSGVSMGKEVKGGLIAVAGLIAAGFGIAL